MRTNPVLLLNASYEPLAVVGAKRAIVLVLQGKADVVSHHPTEQVRSESAKMAMPTVIRLLRYVNVPKFRKAYLSRRTVLARDDSECAYCGGVANTIDHIRPRSLGGRNVWENVVACCYECNQRKANRTLGDLGWTLRYRPYRPEGNRRLVMTQSTNPDWEPWLPTRPQESA